MIIGKKHFLYLPIQTVAAVAAAAILLGGFTGCSKIGGQIPDTDTVSSNTVPSSPVSSAILSSSTVSAPEIPAVSSAQASAAASPAQTAISAGVKNSAGSISSSETAVSRHTAAPAVVYKKYLPVMMYHSIKYEKNNPVRIAPQDFERQIAWLSRNSYTALTMDDARTYYEKDCGFPKKSVLLTFDDGYEDNYTTVFPLLKKYKMTATIFVISGDVGKNGYLSRTQILEMSKWGVNIECHTVTHPYLAKLKYADQIYQLEACKNYIEALTGKPVCYLAYPYGSYSAITIKAAKALGFKMAFKMSGGRMSGSSGALTLPRIFVNGSIGTFINKIA